MDHILDVVKRGLCNGCGTCVGMCPQSALSMRIIPEGGVLAPYVDEPKCDHCGLCIEVCPGKGVSFAELFKDIGFEGQPKLPLGVFVECWRGFSSDSQVRSVSASGGLTTSLLFHALDNHLVDGAMVTRMNRQNPFRAEPFIAQSKQEILEGAGSKYLPVALNSLLRSVLDSDKSCIAVGLPCHIHGIRLAQRIEPRLKKRIPVCISLVCHHTPSYLGMEFILRSMKLPEDRVRLVDYRAGNWPGNLRFTLDDGTAMEIPYSSIMYWGGLLQRFFIPDRCMMCVDKMSVLSDLSCMDAWRMPMTASDFGTGLVVSRTSVGNELVRSAIAAGSVTVTPVINEEVFASQDAKSHYLRRCALVESARMRGRAVPEYEPESAPVGFHELIEARIAAMANAASHQRALWPAIFLQMRMCEVVRSRLKSHRSNAQLP